MPRLEPLAELEVDLELALDELVDVEVAPDAVLGEGGLEELVVGHVLEAGLAGPVDAGDGDRPGEDVLAQLAGDGTGAGLLDLGQIHVERGVEEGQELVLGDEVGRVHEPDARIGTTHDDDAITGWFACSVVYCCLLLLASI